jgi:hypothetical protein
MYVARKNVLENREITLILKGEMSFATETSYLAVLLFSFGFLQLGKLGRIIAIVLWCYIPCGVLISVMPVEQAKALVLGRTIFFVFAFILSAILFFSLAKKAAPETSSQPIR